MGTSLGELKRNMACLQSAEFPPGAGNTLDDGQAALLSISACELAWIPPMFASLFAVAEFAGNTSLQDPSCCFSMWHKLADATVEGYY